MRRWKNFLRINQKQLTLTIIVEKDRVLYGDLQKQKSGPSTRMTIAENLKGSRGWFDNVQKVTCVRPDEAVSHDKAAAEEFVKEFNLFIAKEGYGSQRLFKCDESGIPMEEYAQKDVHHR